MKLTMTATRSPYMIEVTEPVLPREVQLGIYPRTLSILRDVVDEFRRSFEERYGCRPSTVLYISEPEWIEILRSTEFHLIQRNTYCLPVSLPSLLGQWLDGVDVAVHPAFYAVEVQRS